MSDLWKKVKSGTKDIASKTGDAFESGKVKMDIANLNRKVEAIYRQLGEMAEQKQKAGELGMAFSEESVHTLLEEIKVYKQAIATLEKKLK